MPRVYEVPTHLQVEDSLLFGLSARQLVRIAICAALGYQLWDMSAGLPLAVRAALSALLVACGVVLGLVRPGGRALDGWLLAAVLFWLRPRRRVWRVQTPLGETDERRTAWQELEPLPVWTRTRADVTSQGHLVSGGPRG